MSIRPLLLLIVIGIAVILAAEDIPESIRNHEWMLGSQHRSELFYHANFPQAPEPMPDPVWKDAGRQVITILTSQKEFEAKDKEGTWISFIRKHLQNDDDIFSCVLSDKPNYGGMGEIEPVPTRAQKTFCDGLVEKWLPPLPDNFVPAEEPGAGLITWNRWVLGNTARIRAIRLAAPRVGRGGRTESVFWYDRPMTDEDMLMEIAGDNHDMTIRRERGQTIAVLERSYEITGGHRTYVWWPSGQFLISLDFEPKLFDAVVKSYLDKYPSSWPKKFEYDPKQLMLKVLNGVIPELNKHIDDPLEHLRYSFRTYPFDDACQRAWKAMPFSPQNSALPGAHRQAIETILHEWVKVPASQIKVSDYHDAMLAHRREVIATIVAERDRIAKEGIERVKK